MQLVSLLIYDQKIMGSAMETEGKAVYEYWQGAVKMHFMAINMHSVSCKGCVEGMGGEVSGLINGGEGNPT